MFFTSLIGAFASRSIAFGLAGRGAGRIEQQHARREFAVLDDLNERQLRDMGLWREPPGRHRRATMRI